jgi:DNA-binding CsgD family transcriptional regulator
MTASARLRSDPDGERPEEAGPRLATRIAEALSGGGEVMSRDRETERALRDVYPSAAEVYTADEDDRHIVIVVVDRSVPAAPDTAELRRRFRLTTRECEVARLLVQRRTTDEIAKALGISPNTVKRHTEQVLAKMGARTRRDIESAVWPARGDISQTNGPSRPMSERSNEID